MARNWSSVGSTLSGHWRIPIDIDVCRPSQHTHTPRASPTLALTGPEVGLCAPSIGTIRRPRKACARCDRPSRILRTQSVRRARRAQPHRRSAGRGMRDLNGVGPVCRHLGGNGAGNAHGRRDTRCRPSQVLRDAAAPSIASGRREIARRWEEFRRTAMCNPAAPQPWRPLARRRAPRPQTHLRSRPSSHLPRYEFAPSGS